jgi:hypothetical protein
MIISIFAKRWFEKTNGNTYHSVKVYADGKLLGFKPFAYGYDEQYLQSAFEILQEAKIYPNTEERLKSGIKKDYYQFMQDMREHRENFVVECADVARRKDLA